MIFLLNVQALKTIENIISIEANKKNLDQDKNDSYLYWFVLNLYKLNNQ